MPRYVILRHEPPATSARSLHWDLMFENNRALRTWALSREPCPDGVCTAEALPDHRLRYLDYEGPIAGNRGRVTRWDSGTYELEETTDHLWQVRLTGQRLSARVRLASQPGESELWQAVFQSDRSEEA